jgi:hypothetical protein
MKNTLANVKPRAEEAGYIPIQIDGIPEGFSYITPLLQIGNNITGDDYVAFVPNGTAIVKATTIKELLELYNTWQKTS